jgi:hypothetical protein
LIQRTVVRIDAWNEGDGVATVELEPAAGGALVRERGPDGAERVAAALGGAALRAVFARWARPLEEEAAALPLDEAIRVAAGLRRAGADDPAQAREAVLEIGLLRYRSPVDVIANDWLVLREPGRPVLAAPARLVASALRALARAAASSAPDPRPR